MSDCEWKKKKIMVGEGEVVDFIPPKKKVGICENGRITYKLESEVKKPYKLACGGLSCRSDMILKNFNFRVQMEGKYNLYFSNQVGVAVATHRKCYMSFLFIDSHSATNSL